MMRARAVAVGVVALTLGALASVAPVARVVPTCAAAGAHHAALVVEHGDGSVVTSCVAFDTSEISGEQLVTLSGIAWSGQTFGGFGEAVCALDGEPARYVDCPGKDSYWAVFVSSGGGSWRLANVGISSLVLRDGDAEGFRYVPSVGNPIAPTSPAGVCRAPVSAAPSADASSRVTAPSPPGASPPGASPPPSSPSTLRTSAGQIAVAAATAGIARTAGSGTPPPSGPDGGLLAASVAVGALAGLAVLRLMARRRQRRSAA
jgi:hypothetical protein